MRDPIYDGQQKARYNAYLYGAEYEVLALLVLLGEGRVGVDPKPGHNLDIVCAVCVARHEMTHMIPARNACYPGWKLQYSGYLMSGRHDHASPSHPQFSGILSPSLDMSFS
nr:hypothetical protein BaRGS_032949 [Batillaria attramentaria]